MSELFPRIQCPRRRNPRCKQYRSLLHLFNPSRPWSLLLIVLLFLTGNNNNNHNVSINILGKSIKIKLSSLSSSSGVQLTSAQTTLQGYIYWDANSNGLLDNTELFTGVVDTTVQLRSCNHDKNGGSTTTTNNNNHGVVAETQSTWHPLNPGTKFAGHNEIYPNGGYYSFDINNSNSKECVLSDAQIRNGGIMGGCFVSVIALEGFQITSSFPLRHFNYHERVFYDNVVGEGIVLNDVSGGDGRNSVGNSGQEEVVFDWIPYQDVMPNINNNTTTTIQSLSSLINRGYHARTSQCFGYHPNKRTWYIYNTQSSSQATPLQTPNGAQYGYNTLIYGESGSGEKDVYDTTLSMTPVGMSESRWPLELRVSTDVNVEVDDDDSSDGGGKSGHENNGGLILGLKLDSDRTTGDYVLLSDSGNLSEGKGASSNNSGGDGGGGGGEARYEFVSRDGSNFRSALSYFQDVGGVDIGGVGNANNGVITVNNRNGILENPTVMIDVIQSFLWERGNLHKLEEGALELVGLTVVLMNQWSLITVVDKAEDKQELDDEEEGSTSSTQDLIISTGMDGKRSLRGSLSSRDGSHRKISATSNRNLRGEGQQYHYSSSIHRNTIALPEPHLVFEFAVYAKYRETGDASNENEIAAKVSSKFGDIVRDTCNSRRQSLIARIRGRSGYFQGCNPKKQSNNDDSGDGSVTYTAFGGSDKDYVEINIGVVNRFDCDKLLPLYYFEMETLAVRRIIYDSLGMLSRQGEVLSIALQLLQLDDGYYVFNDARAPNDSSNTTAIVSASVVACILLIATIVAIWYVRRERRKLREERVKRRKEKEAKLAAREARKKRKSVRSLKKQARAKKKSVAPSTVSNGEVEPVKVDEGAEEVKSVPSNLDDGGGKDLENDGEGDKNPTENKGVKKELDDDSDDSELERLFDKPSSELQSRSEEDVRPVRQRRRRKKKKIDSESESDSDFNASSQRRRDRRRRRRKKGDVGSETDSKATDQSASNVSGMNNTASSKDEHQSTDKTPQTRSQSSNHESDPVSNKEGEDEDSDPPTRIEVSKRGALQKGISDISLGLVASLKKSFTRAAATLNDLKEDGSDSDAEDKEKVIKTAEKSSGPSREENKDETTRVRRRSRTLTKAMSSFRRSNTETKANDGVERRRRGRPSISRAMSSFRITPNGSEGVKTSKRPAPRRMLSKMGMSMRSVIIGELSSSSDDDSSSDSSSSDDSSSSSSDSSEDLKQKRSTKRVATHNDSTEIKSIRRKASDIDNSGRRKHRRRGGRQASVEGKGGLEESGKMSRTNEYLPDKLDAKLENGPTAADALPQSNSTGLSLAGDSSNAAVAIMKPPSERSLGSKTKSSDSNRAESGSRRSSKDGRRAHRERRRKDRSSRNLPSKKTGRKRNESDKHNSSKRPLRRSNSRKALDSLKSSLTRSFSGKILSQPAKSALESEGEEAKNDKRKSRHSSKKKSSHKHRHRSKDAEKGSHRSKHHRTEESDRGEKASERNSERNSERATTKRRSRKRHSEESSDPDTKRSSSHRRERSQKTSPHRKTKSSSSKHASRKKSSGEGERVSRRRSTESANQK